MSGFGEDLFKHAATILVREVTRDSVRNGLPKLKQILSQRANKLKKYDDDPQEETGENPDDTPS